MQPLLFATHNQNKVAEVQSLLTANLQVISLIEAGIHEEIPEPFATIEENSATKAQYIYSTYNHNCFSEDTGLIVPALGGEPGVFSARYAGQQANALQNIDKLLNKLEPFANKQAHFKTVITLLLEGKQHQFTGICEGHIIHQPSGTEGFGYDPIFIPVGSSLTFAQMNRTEKNKFSHRKKAMAKLLDFFRMCK